MDIVLASASPRRRQLLEMLGVEPLRILPAEGEEVSVPGRSPRDTVLELSAAKAREVAGKVSPEDVVIAADTVVAVGGEIFGKPADASEAGKMLGRLSGGTHSVYTGLAVMRGDRRLAGCEETRVRFRRLTPEEIDAYIATGEPMDKAGAYAVQGRASLFVEGIEGDFFNVMGLPLCRLGKMLLELDVKLI